MRRFARPWLLLITLWIPPSCSSSSVEEEAVSKAPIPVDPLLPGTSAVQVESAGLLAAVADVASRDSEPFAALLVRHRASEVYSALVATVTATRSAEVAARIYDLAFPPASESDGAVALVRHRARSPGAFSNYERRREHVLQAWRDGDAEGALAMLPLDVPSDVPLLRVEALAIEGFAHAAAGQDREAAASFASAAELASQSGAPFLAPRLRLLQHAVEMAAGFDSSARNTWVAAVELAGVVSLEWPGLQDPVFWERALAARPADLAWPEGSASRLARAMGLAPWFSGANETKESAATIVRLAGAQQLLERSELPQALLSFRKAEGEARSPRGRALARLGQSRALAALSRGADARALLAEHLDDPDPWIQGAVRAFVAAIELAEGRPLRAMAILRAVLDKELEAGWPQRGEAMANLGLAYLSTGREEEGLTWLHRGQEVFREQRDLESLLLSLSNELEYARQVGSEEKVGEVERRIEALR